jgi:hypothetical protein
VLNRRITVINLAYSRGIYSEPVRKVSKMPIAIAGSRSEIWTEGFQTTKQESHEVDP